ARVAKQIVEDLRTWIEHEKAEHINALLRWESAVLNGSETLWDERAPEVRSESLAAPTLDKHDSIIRCNLWFSAKEGGSASLNLAPLTGRRTVIAIEQQPNQTPDQGYG